ncbi:MAG: sugar phosphate isomerase/epimerase [Gemmatimonadetes bacterium]|nr:MAG: sugar phosphate isomerase/epimerase [Gemmatimonadota bacterium]
MGGAARSFEPETTISRRRFVVTAALGTATTMVPKTSVAKPSSRVASADDVGLKLGVASYSLRNFSREQAIDMTKSLGVRYINFKSVHLAYDAAPAEFAKARAELAAAGLELVGGGMITFETDTDDGVRKYFDYAKAAGMPVIVCTCKADVLPRIEKFVKQYDIKIAIHNHGPEDPNFPSPYDALKAVKSMDPRMGLCIDLGHTVRAGTDPVRAVADAGPRLLDMHAKDLRDFHAVESQCVVGEGKIPIPEVFRQLRAIRYAGYVNLEYEIEPDNPLPGMRQSLAYMHGVLAGLAATRS